MANTGYISVAPQIAALAAQVTVVDMIVDAIRAVDVPGLAAEHLAIGTVVDDIHDVDLPAVDAIVTANGVILADIHDTDLPAVLTAVNTLNMRGAFTRTAYSQVPGDVNWHDALNVTNPGKLVYLAAQFTTTNGKIRVTLDGTASNDLTVAHTAVSFIKISNTAASFQLVVQAHDHNVYLNLEFNTSLRIEVQQTNGANSMRCLSVIQLD